MAQLDQAYRIADVYAQALFQLARERSRIREIHAELDELLKLWNAEPDFVKFMSSPALEIDAREKIMEDMFRNRLDNLVLNTLLVMNRHGRAGLIPALHRRYVLHKEEDANEIEVTVTSAIELSAEHKAEALQIAVEASGGMKPVAEFRVDAEIIGGLIVKVGSLRLDNSLRRHVTVLNNQLTERAQRALTPNASPA